VKYELILEEHPDYLHAIGRGPRTPENARRFLLEAGEACVNRGKRNLLVQAELNGPPLDTRNIFGVIQDRSRDGMRMRRIAYIDEAAGHPSKAQFAETVARNRGVNVRLFEDVDAAVRWLLEKEEVS
jgi:hypothetical protein